MQPQLFTRVLFLLIFVQINKFRVYVFKILVVAAEKVGAVGSESRVRREGTQLLVVGNGALSPEERQPHVPR